MSAQPPSYDTVIRKSPELAAQRGELNRTRTNESVSTISTDGDVDPGLLDHEDRMSMDDEQRDLPPGWVRCFDPNTKHHFYVEEATRRSIWVHPYDDPEFLNTLPKTHPAHPESKQGKAIRKATEEELEQRKKWEEEQRAKGRPVPTGTAGPSGTSGEHRNWFQKKKDKMIGTKEEREQAKKDKQRRKEEERQRIMKAQQEYIMRRKQLIEQQLNDPTIGQRYASNPYGYAPPPMAFSRAGGLYGSPYGYGYGGGYGRRGYYGGYGGMGMGAPLMGGLAGGMLLGGLLGGGF